MQDGLVIADGKLSFGGVVIAEGLDLVLKPWTLKSLADHIESRPRRGVFWRDSIKPTVEYYVSKRPSGWCLFKRTVLDKSEVVTTIYVQTGTGNYRNSYPTKGEAQSALSAFREHCAANRRSSRPIEGGYLRRKSDA